MERKIGEKFKFNKQTLIVIEKIPCKDCFFFDLNCKACKAFKDDVRSKVGDCTIRNDKKVVIFKKL